ncbi:MAG TPA: tetratricopeptide repeat protein [Armatimonadetes bacterium]|nr:tetratricopeptide repeat protein [Armatimonadota bacterium]
MHNRLGGWAVILLVWGVAFAQAPGGAVSWETKVERELGRQVKYAFEMTVGLTYEPVLLDWVQRVGERVASVAPRQDVDYVFYIANTDEVNAFAAPGGFIFVTRGLLDTVESDDELAGVLAHEIAHVSDHHSRRQIKRQLLILGGLALLGDTLSEDWQRALQVVDYLLALKFSRDLERRADRDGAKFAYQAGFDPDGLIAFFRHLLAREPKRASKWSFLSTHPPTQERLERVRHLPWLAEDDPEVLLITGNHLLTNLRLRAALNHYRRAQQLRPEDAEVWAGLARVHALAGLWEEARREAEKALSLDPQNACAQAVLAEEKRKTKRPAELTAPRQEVEKVRAELGKAAQRARQRKRWLASRREAFQQRLKRIARLREDNRLLDQALWLKPKPADPAWLLLVGQVKALIEELDSALFRAAKAKQELERAFVHLNHLEQQMQDVLQPELPSRCPARAVAAVRQVIDVNLGALHELARGLDLANESLGEVNQATRLLTPILVDLVDPYLASPNRVAWGRFAAVEAALYAASKYTAAAKRHSWEGISLISQAQCRYLQALLSLRQGCGSQAEQRLAVDLAARWLGVSPEQVRYVQELGHPYGEAVVLIFLQRQRDWTIAQLEAHRQAGETWLDVAARLKVDLDALRITLALLLRHLDEVRVAS